MPSKHNLWKYRWPCELMVTKATIARGPPAAATRWTAIPSAASARDCAGLLPRCDGSRAERDRRDHRGAAAPDCLAGQPVDLGPEPSPERSACASRRTTDGSAT